MISRERPVEERTVLRAWGEVIRRYRLWRRLSRRELAQRAGISPVFLGEIERGDKDLSSHTLCLLAAGLGVPVGELYLRVGARLDGTGAGIQNEEQTALPMIVRESEESYLDAIPAANDETAFDLYKIARRLNSNQQVSLLILAQSLAPTSVDQA